MDKRVHAYSTHVVYIRRLSGVSTLILSVDSEITAADWSAEETKGSRQRWGPRIRNTDMDVLPYVISSMRLSRDILRWSDNLGLT